MILGGFMLPSSEVLEAIDCLSANETTAQYLDIIRNYYATSLNTMTHEIQNIITYLSSSVQLVEKKHPEVTTYEYWKQINIDLKHIKNLTADLSNLSKSAKLRVQDTDFKLLLNTIINIISPILISKNITTSLNYPDYIPTNITCDATKIKQVIINLYKNSAEAINSNGNIEFNVSLNGPYLQLSISDTGPGIDAKNLDKIWELYYTSKEYGTGIGLPLSKQIVEAHKGQIYYSTNINGGATFTIMLPI